MLDQQIRGPFESRFRARCEAQAGLTVSRADVRLVNALLKRLSFFCSIAFAGEALKNLGHNTELPSAGTRGWPE